MTRFSPGFVKGGVSPTRWNPLDKTEGVALSNGNLTTTFSDTDEMEAVRSVAGASGGKAYFEFTPTTLPFGGGGPTTLIGFASASHILKDALGSDPLSVGWLHTGQIYFGGALWGTSIGWFANQTMAVAVDFGAKRVWFRGLDGDWNGVSEGGADPEFGTSGVPYTTAGLMFAVAQNINGGVVMDANFGGSPFAHAVPAGFTPGFG